MKQRLTFLALGLVLLPCVGCQLRAEPGGTEARQASPSDSPPLNVVLVVIDVLRADHVGVYGYDLPTTPNIDRLARDNVYFSAAFANASWTKPSVASLFTSLPPSGHGATEVSDAGATAGILADDLTTLAEVFSGAGYRTGAILVQPHLQAKFGFAQGFDIFQRLRGKGGGRQNNRFAAFLDQDDGRPFFAYVHYLEVHWPYNRHLPGQEETFGSTAIDPEPPISQLDELARWVRANWNASNRAGLIARYDQGVAVADTLVGDLLTRLHRAGLDQNTVVVVTSDHGEGFLDHGELGHGLAPYDEQVHVPLVLELPRRFGMESGERGSLVSLIDVGPTLLDLAGIEAPGDFEGSSFRAALEGRETPVREVFVETDHGDALRTPSRKLIVRPDRGVELFDLSADPLETDDLASPVCDGVCGDLLDRLRRHQSLHADRVARPAQQRSWSSEDIEDLVALGYREEE